MQGVGTSVSAWAWHGDLLVDVSGAEPDGGRAAVDVGPLVVGISDAELARVLVRVAVGVADERSLPLFWF
jgi:hypothetical protein